MEQQTKWSLFSRFIQDAYCSKSIEEILELLPPFLCTILQTEKMLFIENNELLEEVEVKQSYGYNQEELQVEKEDLEREPWGTSPAEKTFLFGSLPKEENFFTYTLLVKGKKIYPHYFDQEDQEIFNSVLYQLALLIKKFSLIENSKTTFLDTIQALARTIDARCENTKGHSERVTQYSVALAKALGWSEEQIEHIRQAALLHDIGKIGVPDNTLKKEGPLTDEEWEQMRMHPLHTVLILNGVAGLQSILSMAQYHHERYDGGGYPAGIAGENIPLGARIIAVADAFDAMTADRVYRKAMPVSKALEIIKECAGTQFDPQVASIFIKIMEARGNSNQLRHS